MKRFSVELDDETAGWLAAKIDDSEPTVRDVAHGILRKAAHAQQALADPARMESRMELAAARICTCGELESAAVDANSPIVFDAAVNEYHLLRNTAMGPSKFLLRYCYWCGGRAPKLSTRS